MSMFDEKAVRAAAKSWYETQGDTGYDEDDPKSYWMAEDGYWPPSTKMVVWQAWIDDARKALAAAEESLMVPPLPEPA